MLYLIELLEQYTCLYDTKHTMYFNKHARAAALEQIRQEINIPNLTVADVRQKIYTIRTQVSQERKKKLKVREVEREVTMCTNQFGGLSMLNF